MSRRQIQAFALIAVTVVAVLAVLAAHAEIGSWSS
jgi:hypothetical protein